MGTRFNVFTNKLDLVDNQDTLVVGPAVATDNAIARFDGTTGKLIQNSGSTLSDSDVLSTGTLNLTTDLAVQYGGSGRSTATSYGVVCGGTTAAGAHQSIASVGTSAQVLTSNGAGALPTFQAAAGGGDMPEVVKGGLAASHQVNSTTAFAPVSYRDFTNIEMLVRSFDDTGPEYMESTFRVPADLGAGSSSVTFEIVGSAASAVADKNVKFTFDFVQVADDGLLTGPYASPEVWDDQSISGTANDQDIISNTETITNLGWVAGRMIYYRLYRAAATTNNLSGDYDVISFNIRIPRA